VREAGVVVELPGDGFFDGEAGADLGEGCGGGGSGGCVC
jgi:hypothetical protein